MIPESIKGLLPFFNKKDKSEAVNSLPGISDTSRKVDWIASEFDKVLSFNQSDLDRESESWDLFSGIGDSQYPEEIKAKLKTENRNIIQVNFTRNKVEGLAGSVIKNFFDIDFVPIDAEASDLTRQVKELLLIDKELTDWSSSYHKLVKNGLIHLGIEEMYINFDYSPLGNIGFRTIEAGHILLDPLWISDTSRDLKRAFKIAYLTAKEIKEIYKTKSQEIDDLIKLKQLHSTEFDLGDQSKNVNHSEFSETYGDTYRVIEYHHMEKEKKTVRISISTGLVIPEGPEDFIQEWAIINKIDINDPNEIITRDEDVDVYYITSICPTISRYLVLEDKKALIQIGRLPFFPWSVGRINGKNSGIPELLKSIQRTYNYRESMLDYMISTNAAGGMLLDPQVVDNDPYKMERIEQNWNKPKFREWTAPGALASGREFIKELPRTNPDYTIVQEITRLIDMADRVSKQPAVLDARSEGSEETGILYARKQLQAEITHTLMIRTLQQLWNEKGEAWLYLAKNLYSGVYREFYIAGKKKIELNKPIVTATGEVVQNDISQLPRMKVCITESPEGVTLRSIDRSINTELLRVIGQENPLSRAQAVKNVMKTLDNSKEEKARYEEAAEIEYQFARENLELQIMGARAQKMQLQMQMMQMGGGGIMGAPQGQGQPQEAPSNAPGNPMQTIAGSDAEVAQPTI